VLRRPSEFEAVLRSAVRVATRNFVGRALANGAVQPRLGMIAGKKAAPRAVDRNRAKRLIRELFRTASPGFGAYDVAIQLRTDLRSHDNEAVRTELRGLLSNLAKRCAYDAARQNSPAPSPGVPAGTSPDRQ
jgi:ribonuclease P protein component